MVYFALEFDRGVLVSVSATSNLVHNSPSASALRSLVHCSVSGRWPGYTSVPISPSGPEEMIMNTSASVTSVTLARKSDSVTPSPASGSGIGRVVRLGPLGTKPWQSYCPKLMSAWNAEPNQITVAPVSTRSATQSIAGLHGASELAITQQRRLLPPRDAATASSIPTPPRDVSSMVLAADLSKSSALSVPAAQMFDEMWSYHSGTAGATLTWQFSGWLGCRALGFLNLMGSHINRYSWSLHMHFDIASIEFVVLMSARPPPNQMISQFVKPVPAECNEDLHQLIERPINLYKMRFLMLLPSLDEVHCSAYVQHFCPELIYLESYTREHVTVLLVSKPSLDEVPCSACVQHFCPELIYLESYTREHVTVLLVLSRGKGFKFRMLNEDESRHAMLLVFANMQDLPNNMNAGNVIIFTRDDVLVLLHKHIGQGEVVDHLWKGQMGLSEEQQKQALELRNMINGGKESLEETGTDGASCNPAATGGCCQGNGASRLVFLGYLFDVQFEQADDVQFSFLDRAEIGSTPGLFTVVVCLSNWLSFRLLWKPPWQVPALTEFIDGGISWVLFLAIASVYGYWSLKWFLALFSCYWRVPMGKEMVLGYLIWSIRKFSCNCLDLIDARLIGLCFDIHIVAHEHDTRASKSSQPADRKSKLLLLRESDHEPTSIPKLVEGLNCPILRFSVQLLPLMIIWLATISAAWGQAAFQGEGNVRYLHQLGCLSAQLPRNKPQQQLEEGRKGGIRHQPKGWFGW